MSDKLMINGKKYVSASIAASMTKYTQDYVGQLCRGNKVNATRIGRNWYVDIDSLLLHKEQSENNVVEVKISTPQDIETQNELAKKPEMTNDVQPLVVPQREEINETPTYTSSQRIVGEHIANYSADKSPLLPPIKKISAEGGVENTHALPENDTVQPELEENAQQEASKIPQQPYTPSMFDRVVDSLQPTGKRLALGLVIIVMFSATFTLNTTKIQFMSSDIASVESSIFEKETILAATLHIKEIFEKSALEINDFVDNTTYDFLYGP